MKQISNTQIQSQRHGKRFWLVTAVGAAAIIALLIAGIGYVRGGFDISPTRSVEDLLASSAQINPAEATQELCGEPGCVEGWRTTAGSFLRFSSEGKAEYWATLLGDEGRRYKNIVLDMRGTDLSFEEKQLAIDTLFSRHDWS
jgi:hypothetical protein